MVNKVSFTEFSSFSKFSNLRMGGFYELPNCIYKYRPFNEVISLCESGSRPKGGIKDEDFGQALSLGGEQIDVDGSLNLQKTPYIPTEFFEKASKGKVRDKDILLCKDGALTGKVCFVDAHLLPCEQVMVNEHVYIVRSNEEYTQTFLFYLMRMTFFKNQIVDLAYRKKGQPGLNFEHLKALKVPDIPIQIQRNFENKILPLTHEIASVESNVKRVQNIIDEIFGKEFGFDYGLFTSLKSMKYYTSSFVAFSNNQDLRSSAKFHRQAGEFVMSQLVGITDKKIKHYLSEPIVLGASISPDDYSDKGDYYYISMATIKDWTFNPEGANTVSTNYSDAKKSKAVKKGDILLARSGEGTIGKVALIQDDYLQGIFADFTMRICLRNYNPEFAYYYFRTSYFQYLIEIYKKGLGNNTNIFPIVVQEFPLIDITLDEQQRIVDEVHTEIEKQNNAKAKIAELRSHIDAIIEKTIFRQAAE